MKKIILLASILLATVTFSQRIGEGESQLNAGIGFGSIWGIPLYVGFDYGVHPDITVGGQLSYVSGSNSYGNTSYRYTHTVFVIGANANYHFNTLLDMPNKYDLYAGLDLAYKSITYNDDDRYSSFYDSREKSRGLLLPQFGFRYYFTDNVAVNVELIGTVPSLGKIGVTYKF